jgi:hypothetical protein
MAAHRAVWLHTPEVAAHNVLRVLQRVGLVEAKVDEVEPIQAQKGRKRK